MSPYAMRACIKCFLARKVIYMSVLRIKISVVAADMPQNYKLTVYSENS